MARNTSTAQANVLGQRNRWNTFRAFIQDVDGNWRNLSHPADTSPPTYDADPGQNWLESFSHQKGDDQRVETLSAFFSFDQTGGLSLSPLMENSSANVDSVAAYAALLDAGRLFRLETALTAFGSDASEAAFETLFVGEVDSVDFDRNPIEVRCRDLGAHLEDRWIESASSYGSTGLVSLQAVMQSILTDWTDGVTLYSPSGTTGVSTAESPGAFVDPYLQEPMPVMEALQVLAGRIGWDLRYRWHNPGSTFRLVLSEPDRTVTTPDYTFGPSQYFDVTTLNIDRTNVRNAVVVRYFDANGLEQTSSAKSTGSIARYGRRFMEITNPEGITTSSEAAILANAALADLEEPDVEQEIVTLFDWRPEINDYVRHSANSVHYSTAQDLAVIGVRHDVQSTQHLTYLRVRGKPAGSYRDWTTRFDPQEVDLRVNSWEWVPITQSRLTGASSFLVNISEGAWGMKLDLKPLRGCRSFTVAMSSSTGALNLDTVDISSASLGPSRDLVHFFQNGSTTGINQYLFREAIHTGQWTVTVVPYASTGASGGAGEAAVFDAGWVGFQGWGQNYVRYDGVVYSGTRLNLRPFFSVGQTASTSAQGVEPRLTIGPVYDSGTHSSAATWTPDYANGPAQYRFFQRDCEIRFPTTLSTVSAETFHMYLDANGYTITFDDAGYSFPGGIASPVGLTHYNGIINHQGKLSGVVLPNMQDGGVNLGV